MSPIPSLGWIRASTYTIALEKDVYKLLIDSFRMRQADDMNLEGITTPGSSYTGKSSSIEPFRQYLAKAAARKVLPPWWTADK